jgi:PAS domain S-box-containing protein
MSEIHFNRDPQASHSTAGAVGRIASKARSPIVLVLATVGAGAAATWITGTYIGFLCPFTAAFLVTAGRFKTLVQSVFGLGFLVAVAVALKQSDVTPSTAWSAAALFGLSFLICEVIRASPSRIESSRDTTASTQSGVGEDQDVPASLSVVHPEDRASASHAAAYAFWTGVPQVIKYRQRQSDGQYRWAEMRAEPGYGVSVSVDPMISDHDERWLKMVPAGETAEAISAAKVIESLYGKAWALNAEGQFTYVTPSGQIAIGMALEDLNRPLDGKRFVDGGNNGWSLDVHADDYQRAADSFRHSLRTGEHWQIEYRMLRTTGLYVWHRIAACPTIDASGRITGWYGASIDIDVYKRTEAALRESERALRQLIETVPALIWCTSADGEPIYFSQQFRDFLGFDVQARDVEGMTRLAAVLESIVHPNDRAVLTEKFLEALKTGVAFAFKHRMRRFDGEFRWVEMRVAAMRKEDGTIVQWNGVCFDVEDQVRSQEELRRAHEKYARASQAASLAELSASIAHEVGQPLATLVSSSDACERWLRADPPNLERAKTALERVTRSAATAVETVKRVRALFRRTETTRDPTSLEDVILEASGLLAEEASKRDISVSFDASARLPLVSIDKVQIQQVLTNLIRNSLEAMDAMEGDKRLIIRADCVDQEVRVDVTDVGPGVENPERIFEPFFTTKGHHGMGMGLAICRSIVESHGGRLWVEPVTPTGATFSFTLPTATAP